MNINNTHSINAIPRKQRGATLFTALVFLTLMTIVSVSAAKIASLDAIVAGNNQQQMLVFQQTDKTLNGFSNPVRVVVAISENGGVEDKWDKILNPNPDTSVNATREIKNRGIDYPCKAEGLATSVGNSSAPKCYVFDLSAEDSLVSFGMSDKHYRGVGKFLPNNSAYTD